jgi:hypothetical protein
MRQQFLMRERCISKFRVDQNPHRMVSMMLAMSRNGASRSSNIFERDARRLGLKDIPRHESPSCVAVTVLFLHRCLNVGVTISEYF